MLLRSAQRMNTPLLASSLAQNSTRIMKSLYELFDTRYAGSLPPCVAWIAPPVAVQLAVRKRSKFSRPFSPSTSLVQPLLPPMLEQPAIASAAMAAETIAVVFIALSPPVEFARRLPAPTCSLVRLRAPRLPAADDPALGPVPGAAGAGERPGGKVRPAAVARSLDRFGHEPPAGRAARAGWSVDARRRRIHARRWLGRNICARGRRRRGGGSREDRHADSASSGAAAAGEGLQLIRAGFLVGVAQALGALLAE